MANSVLIHIRVDVEVKTQATEVLSAMGLLVSDAVRMLLKRVIRDKAFPLDLKPNAVTRKAMAEARGKMKSRSAPV